MLKKCKKARFKKVTNLNYVTVVTDDMRKINELNLNGVEAIVFSNIRQLMEFNNRPESKFHGNGYYGSMENYCDYLGLRETDTAVREQIMEAIKSLCKKGILYADTIPETTTDKFNLRLSEGFERPTVTKLW